MSEASVTDAEHARWLVDAPREGAPAGIVRIELPADALPWRDGADEQVLRKRAQYTGGVEYIARAHGAVEPIAWDGDAATLVIGGVLASELPLHTYRAAVELWSRTRLDLGVGARIAAHVGLVRAGSEPGTVIGGAVDECACLAAAAATGHVILSEELALALPDAQRNELTAIGSPPGDERIAHIFPKSGASVVGPSFVTEPLQRAWSGVRRYASGPDVKLVRYVGFRLHKRQPPMLDIREVFVPSEIELRRRADDDLRQTELLEGNMLPPPWSAALRATRDGGVFAFRDLFVKHRSLAVLGDPGSGKTTLLRWLSVIAASGSFAVGAELGVYERLLPILVSVGRLAEVRRGFGADAVSVPAAMARYLHDRSVHEDEAALRDILVRELEGGRCLLLLDGLDEVRSDERRKIHQWLEAFAAMYPENRYVVSSRVVGYAGFNLPGDTAEAVLRPFTDAQVERYVKAFHRAYIRSETGEEPTTQAEALMLIEALRASSRLSALARNPFMLSALALIHRAEGRLPRHRVQAYALFARALCETWADARRIVASETNEPTIAYEEEALPILGELAIAMHEQYPTGVAPEEFVIEKLAGALGRRKNVEGEPARRAARAFLKRAGEDVQILLERGAGAWGFLHLTFQEFFVAAGLHANEQFEDVAFQHLFDPRWEEVLRLGVGYMALEQKRPKAAERFVRKVLDHQQPEPRGWFTLVLRKQVPLAALLAAEAGDALPVALQERIASELANWLKTAPERAAQAVLVDLALTEFSTRAAAACRPLLRDEQERVRRGAASALGKLRAVEVVDDLVVGLSDASFQVSRAAATSLAELPVENIWERVRSKFDDTAGELRSVALHQLAPLGAKIPINVLYHGTHDPSPGVRATAIRMIHSRDPTYGLELAKVALKDPERRVRESAILSLAFSADTQTLKALIDDDDSYIAAQATTLFSILAKDDVDAAFVAKVRARFGSPSSDKAFDAVSSVARVHARNTLQKASLEDRLAALRHPDDETRCLAAGTLQESESAVGALGIAARDPSPDVRLAAIRSLGTLGSALAFDACVAALADVEPSVRLAAAVVLAPRRRPEAMAALLETLQSGTIKVFNTLAESLSFFGVDAVDALVLITERADSRAIEPACRVIGRFGAARHAEHLIAVLHGREGTPAADALRDALWQIADREARRSSDPS